MRTCYLLGLLVCLLLALTAAQAQEAKAEPSVTLSVTDRPAAEVAAEIAKQAGFPVTVLVTDATVTLDLKDAKPEEAVKAFAEALQASWLRAYFLQPKGTDYVYTAEQYLQGLTYQREAWLASFTDEERQQMMRSWFGGMGRGRGQGMGPGGGPGGEGGPPPAAAAEPGAEPAQPQYTREQLAAMPGAGRSALTMRGFGGPGGPGGPGGAGAPGAQGAPPAEGQPPAGGPGERRFTPMDDPVGNLIIPVRKETVTLELADADLAQALFDFTTASGFLAVASTDLTGKVTLKAEEAKLDETLDQLAAAVEAKWQPIYLLGVPREIPQAEMEQRMEQGFQNRMAEFWAKPKEERAADVQRMVDRIERFTQMRRDNPGQQGPGGDRMRRMGERMLGRMQRYSATLSMEQRRELLPLIRAMGAAINQQ